MAKKEKIKETGTKKQRDAYRYSPGGLNRDGKPMKTVGGGISYGKKAGELGIKKGRVSPRMTERVLKVTTNAPTQGKLKKASTSVTSLAPKMTPKNARRIKSKAVSTARKTGKAGVKKAIVSKKISAVKKKADNKISRLKKRS
tara:strand:+ start:125 stop:553 length:429 start_codon:yes stop_codon:yes gene_type:complete